MNFSMNTELIISYDEKTTIWLDQAEKMLKDYQDLLWKKIKDLKYESSQSRMVYFDEDPVRRALVKEIVKVKSLAIPVIMTIVPLDKQGEETCPECGRPKWHCECCGD